MSHAHSDDLIPVIVVDTMYTYKDRMIFVEKSQMQKKHVFLPVIEGSYSRLAVPSNVSHAFVLTHTRGSFPVLKATTNSAIMNKIYLTRLLTSSTRKNRLKKVASASNLGKDKGKHLTCS